MKIICPTCNIELKLNIENKSRPFCSERCRLIDLGQWFEENYNITETFPNEVDADLNTIKKH